MAENNDRTHPQRCRIGRIGRKWRCREERRDCRVELDWPSCPVMELRILGRHPAVIVSHISESIGPCSASGVFLKPCFRQAQPDLLAEPKDQARLTLLPVLPVV